MRPTETPRNGPNGARAVLSVMEIARVRGGTVRRDGAESRILHPRFLNVRFFVREHRLRDPRTKSTSETSTALPRLTRIANHQRGSPSAPLPSYVLIFHPQSAKSGDAIRKPFQRPRQRTWRQRFPRVPARASLITPNVVIDVT
jgi:hypothetical protein